MGGISTLRAASSAVPHVRRIPHAGEIGASSSLHIVAPASPAVARSRFVSTSLADQGRRRIVAAPTRLQAHCLPARQDECSQDRPEDELPQSPTTPRRLPYAGEVGAISSPSIVAPASPAVARCRFLSTSLGSRRTAAAPSLQAHCLSARQAEGTQGPPPPNDEPPLSPTTPGLPWWGPVVCSLSSQSTKRPVIHFLAVLVLSGIKSTGFRGFVEQCVARFKLPEKLTVGLMLGAAIITILFDAAVVGKEINDVCSYLLTHIPKVPEADLNKTASTSD